MNYIEERAKAIAIEAGETVYEESEKLLYYIYAVLSFSKGKETTLEDVHDAWAAWSTYVHSENRFNVPFNTLSKEEQELDRLFMQAIHSCS